MVSFFPQYYRHRCAINDDEPTHSQEERIKKDEKRIVFALQVFG